MLHFNSLMATIILPEGIINERCDKILSQQLHLSRAIVKFSFHKTPFMRNGHPIHLHEKVCSGDVIGFEIHSLPFQSSPSSDGFNLRIIFEDEDLIVIDKPAGIAVHPAPGLQEKTLVEHVVQYCPLSCLGEQDRPGVVHRLDKDTTGVMIFAKSNRAFRRLAADFANHFIEKWYTCIVHGTLALDTGKIEIPIARKTNDKIKMIACPSGKPAKTTWIVHERFEHFTKLNVKIYTGRTHQIRVHMSHIGHPIAGDSTYGPKHRRSIFPRMMLHAESIAFTHPQSNEKLSFTAPIPKDFADALNKLHLTNRSLERTI
ncbi:MAG: RluA family pseudouridine synthase [Puniceicoccales bacterium]|nr:RluA family pseudouridine synthase [Puniceicoccales bacterium]